MLIPTFEILAASDPDESKQWGEMVADSIDPDVYYLPAYSLATSEIENSKAIAFISDNSDSHLLAPLLIRRLSSASNTPGDWKDAASPYGYGGLLSTKTEAPSSQELQTFFQNLRGWCSAQKVVCCVIRLHSLTSQADWFARGNPFPDFLQLHRKGITTALNLEDWDMEHERPRGMKKGRKSDLNVARRSLNVSWTKGSDPSMETSMQHFQTLYTQAMDGHEAGGFYRFPPSYFSRLASLGEQCSVALAWLDNEPAGGSIFLFGRDYAHYHLAANNEIGVKHRAGTLLVVEGARYARERGCRLLHLGGGLRSGDSLEDFKFSFGGETYHYAYLVLIADPERFEQIRSLPDAPWPYNVHQSSQAEKGQ